MEVSIKSLDGQNKKFEAVPLDYTVRQFKDLIFSQMNIPVESQRLIFQGRVLQDDKTLASYNVADKVVHLVQRQPPPPPSEHPLPSAEPQSPTPDDMVGPPGMSFMFDLGPVPFGNLIDNNQIQQIVETVVAEMQQNGSLAEGVRPQVATRMTPMGLEIELRVPVVVPEGQPPAGAPTTRLSLARLRETYIRRQMAHARRLIEYILDPEHVPRPSYDDDALFPDPVHFMPRPELNDLAPEPTPASGSTPASQSARPPDTMHDALSSSLQDAVGSSPGPSASENSLASASATSTASNPLSEGTRPPPPTSASSRSLSNTASVSSTSTARPPPRAAAAAEHATADTSDTEAPRTQFDRSVITTPLPLPALGELVRESTELAELARPAFERWQELLLSDPELSEPVEGESAASSSASASATSEAPATRRKTRARRAQELHDQCARLMHLLSHVWHSVSQFLVDFPGTPHPPRNLYVLSQLPIGTVFMQPVSTQVTSTTFSTRVPVPLRGNASPEGAAAVPQPPPVQPSAPTAGGSRPQNETTARSAAPSRSADASRPSPAPSSNAASSAQGSLPGLSANQTQDVLRQVIEQSVRSGLGQLLQASTSGPSNASQGGQPMVYQTAITGPVPTVLHQEVVLNQLPQPNRHPAPAPLRAPQLSSRANATSSAGGVPVRAAGSMPMPQPPAGRMPQPPRGRMPQPPAGRMPQPPAGRMPRPPAGRMPWPLFPAPPMVQMPNPFMQMMGLAMPPMAPMPPGGAVPQASGTLPQFLPPGIPTAGQSSPQLSTLDPYLACTARQWTRDFEEADEESEDDTEGSSTEQQQVRATGRTPRRQQQQSELPMNAITITIPNVAVNAQLGFGPNGGPAAPPSPGGFPIPGVFPPGAPVPPPGAIPNPMQMIQQLMPMLMAGMTGMAGGPRPPGAPPAGFLPGGPFMAPGPAAGAGGMMGAGMPTMGQLIAAMGGRVPNETGAQSMFEQLLVAITSRLNLMDNVALMNGDFRPLNNLQPVIREYLTRSLFNNDPNAGLDPDRQKQAAEQIMLTFAETNMATGLQANPNNSRGAVDLAATYRQVELSLLVRLIRSTYSESDRAYGDRIHDAFGDFMFELQVVSNHCVVGGYDAFLNNLERVIRQTITNTLGDTSGMMALLTQPLVANLIHSMRTSAATAAQSTGAEQSARVEQVLERSIVLLQPPLPASAPPAPTDADAPNNGPTANASATAPDPQLPRGSDEAPRSQSHHSHLHEEEVTVTMTSADATPIPQPLPLEPDQSRIIREDESVTLASVLNATLGSIAAEAGPVAAEVSPLPPEWMSIVAGDRPRLQSEPPPPPEPAPHSNYASAAASSSSNSDPATEPPYSNAYIAGMPAKRRKLFESKQHKEHDAKRANPGTSNSEDSSKSKK